jgi:hypothetical protein
MKTGGSHPFKMEASHTNRNRTVLVNQAGSSHAGGGGVAGMNKGSIDI